MSDVWDAPGAEDPQAKPVKSALESPEDIGPMAVPTAVWEDLQANPAGWFLSGLAYFVAVIGLIVVAISAIGLGVMPGVVLEDENVLVIGGMIGFTIYTLLILVFSFVGFPMMTASMLRNHDDWRRDAGTGVGFTSLFNQATGNLGGVIGLYLLGQLLILIGVFMLYVPGLIAMALITFAMPIVVLEELPVSDALGKAWAHMRQDPAWHVAVWLLLSVAIMAVYFTIIGMLLIFPVMVLWQYHAYRIAFPDGAAAWEP